MSSRALRLTRCATLAWAVAACGTAPAGAPAGLAGPPGESSATVATDLVATRIADGVRIEATDDQGRIVWSRRFRQPPPAADGGAPGDPMAPLGHGRPALRDANQAKEPPAALLAPAGDGGAFVVLWHDLLRLGPDGQTAWSHPDLVPAQPVAVPGGGVVTAIELDGQRRLARYGLGGGQLWLAAPHREVTTAKRLSPPSDGRYVAIEGRLVHVFDDSEGTHVRHLDSTSGAVLVEYRCEADAHHIDGEGTLTLHSEPDRSSPELYRGPERLAISPPPGDSAAAEPAVAGLVVFTDGAAVAGSFDGMLAAFGPDGSRQWSRGLEAPIDRLAGLSHGVLVLTADHQLVAVARDGRLRWQRSLPGPLATAGGYGVATTADGTVLVGSADGGLCAVAPDGQVSWCRTTSVDFSAGFTVNEGKIEVQGVATPLLLTGSPPPEPAAAPETRPLLAFRRQPLGAILSLVARPGGEAWALEARDVPYDVEAQRAAWQLRAGRWHYQGVPNEPMTQEAYTLELKRNGSRSVGQFMALQLASDPGGVVWSLGLRHSGYLDNGLYEAAARLSRFSGARWQQSPSLPDRFTEDMETFGLAVARGDGPLLLCANQAGGRPSPGLQCARRAGTRWQESSAPGQLSSWGDSRSPGDLRWIGGQAWLATSDGQLLRLGTDGWDPVAVPKKIAAFRALWGTGPGDLWAIVHPKEHDGRTELYRFDGRSWTRQTTPFGPLSDIWGSASDDVWVVGEAGAAHYDGQGWLQVHGLARDLWLVTGSGRHDVWIGGAGGLWHGTALPAPQSGAKVPVSSNVPGPSRTWPEPWAVDGPETRFRAKPVELAVPGGPALTGALGVAALPDGTTWFHDRRRLIEHDGTSARLVHELGPAESNLGFFCHGCLAPTAPGRGWFVSPIGIHRVDGGGVTRAPHELAIHHGISASGATVWTVGRGDEAALERRDGIWSYRTGLPQATYADVSVAGPEDVWMVGGLGRTGDGLRQWPAAEGIVAHYDGTTAHWYRAPGGALLDVAAVGPREAWAVGAAGSIVHIKEGTARHRFVPSRAWLRGVWASGADDVWMVGDDATLLHWDGRELRQLTIGEAYGRMPFSGVAGASANDLWVVGPRALFRIRRPPPG